MKTPEFISETKEIAKDLLIAPSNFAKRMRNEVGLGQTLTVGTLAVLFPAALFWTGAEVNGVALAVTEATIYELVAVMSLVDEKHERNMQYLREALLEAEPELFKSINEDVEKTISPKKL